ncbi:GlyGly-CTERM sorting domain-containing protein, partial [Vibrio sp. 945]|nr:GlyGly-CTERM sorting domain-containing protein [Vibrio sp. 945]
LDPNESVDSDGDGTGNNADNDDDGDGVNDSEDGFPLDPSESVDTDGDGIGNNVDNDDDGDGINDSEDAFPHDSNESVDTDGDGIGNNADNDDDGDGMDDEWEVENGLDPLSADTPENDTDGDGISDLEEFLQGTNPNEDSAGPEFNYTAEIWIKSEELYTLIDAGEITATDFKDGNVDVVPLEVSERLPSGRHIFKYLAEDSSGNQTFAEQLVNVVPLVNLGNQREVEADSTVELKVFLNGESPTYPVVVPYTISTLDSQSGEQGVEVYSDTFIIEEGVEGQIEFDSQPYSEDFALGGFVLELTDDGQTNIGNRTKQLFSMTEGNIAPEINLTAKQSDKVTTAFSQSEGMVTLKADIIDPNAADTHQIDWILPASLQNYLKDGNAIEFEPSQLEPGSHVVSVTVTDSGTPALTTQYQVAYRVYEALPSLSDTLDLDNDSLSDAQEGFADLDRDGIPDFADNLALGSNVVNHMVADGNRYLLESDAGTQLTLGDLSANTQRYGALVETGDVSSDGEVLTQDFVRNIGGMFDFEVHNLEKPGQSVRVVIPQRNPLPEDAVYRKWTATKGWFSFHEDQANALYSAPGTDGFCPPPGDTTYSQGLSEGNWCVQLLIQDGGPNDTDGLENGSITDPGGVSQKYSVDSDVTNSGGSFGWASGLLLALISIVRRRVGKL